MTFPYFKWVGMPAGGVCVVNIRTDKTPVDANVSTDVKNGAFVLNQWGPDIDVIMARLEDTTEVYDANTSALYSKNQWFLNREHKDGDLTGAVPAKLGVNWTVVFINYDMEEYDWVQVEYGAGTNLLAVGFTLLSAALTALAF